MAEIKPDLVLACHHCGQRPPPDSVMEAQLLHFQIEHDTDDVHLDLVAVCTCGATMTLTETRPTGGGFHDYFCCEPCGNTGRIKRGERP